MSTKSKSDNKVAKGGNSSKEDFVPSSQDKKGSLAVDEDEVCDVCGGSVEESGIQCELCDYWYHYKCVGFLEDVYKALTFDSVHWYCKHCNVKVAEIIKALTKAQVKIERLEKEMAEVKMQVNSTNAAIGDLKNDVRKVKDDVKEIAHIKSVINTLTTDMTSLKDAVKITDTKIETAIEASLVNSAKKPSFAAIVSKEVDSRLESVVHDVSKVKETIAVVRKSADEEIDRENRSHNIIIYNIPEVQDRAVRIKQDKDFILDLFNVGMQLKISTEDIKSVFRLGRLDNNKARPLMVQFRDRNSRSEVMDLCYRLKDAEDRFRNLSIAYDLSKTEREVCKKMLDEAKQNFAGNSGELVWKLRGTPGQFRVIKYRKV